MERIREGWKVKEEKLNDGKHNKQKRYKINGG